MKLEKIYLIWICPTYNSFEWFSDLVAKLTEKLESIDQLDVLDLRIYLSRGWDDKFARVRIIFFFYWLFLDAVFRKY